MKKVLALLMAAAMIFSFAACGESKTQESNVSNPWVQASGLDELNEKFGARLAAPGAMGVTDESFSYIDSGSSRIAQYNFKIGGYDYTFRFSDTDLEGDISGISAGSGTLFSAFSGDANASTSDVKAARWYTVDGQYCLTVNDGGKIDAADFEATAEEMRSLTVPEESKGDLTAADFAGSYQDSFSGRASLDVTAENGIVKGLVSWGNGASDTVIWTMTLELEDEKLVYTDCTCEEHIWNEKDEEKVNVIFENAVGYFEIGENGSLLWTGSSEESCKDCCFEK